MAMNMRKLFEALIRFLEAKPDGTAQAFVAAAVKRDLGTQQGITKFLMSLAKALQEAGFVDDATWDAVVARLGVVGFERFRAVAEDIFARTARTPVFEDLIIEDELGVIEGELTKLLAKRDLLDLGVAWVKTNMPTGEQKAVVLDALQQGRSHAVDGPVLHFSRLRDQKKAPRP